MRDLFREADQLLERAQQLAESDVPHGVSTRDVLYLELIALVVVALERQTEAIYETRGRE